jgi:hypothetical protein
MSFFVTSVGSGKGGDLGGLAGADARCQALATAEGAGDKTWHAYLSASATDSDSAVHARERIGRGPWYNANGLLIAGNIEQLHSTGGRLNNQTALTETFEQISGAANAHADILTGSRPDGTAFDRDADLTCRNWTSSDAGRAQVGHHDRAAHDGAASWNSSHASSGCSAQSLEAAGGARFYCFAVD